MACDATVPLSRLNNSGSFSTWYTNTKVAVDAITTETPANETALQTLESDITKTLTCAQLTFQSLSNTPSNLSRLTSEHSALRGELDKAKKNAQVAKERAQMITSPEKRSTVYEGWFPLFRPLQLTSMLIIIGFGLFFLTISLGLFTNILGFIIQLGYELPFRVPNPGGNRLMSPLILGGGAVTVILIGVIIYAFTRRS